MPPTLLRHFSPISMLALMAMSILQSCAPSTTMLDTRTVATVRVRVVGDPWMTAGQTTQLVVTLLDSTGAVVAGREIAYASSDTTVVTVSSTGKLFARAKGIITLTARTGQVSGIATISVAPPTPSFAQIEVGESETCALTANGALYCWRNAIGPFAGSSQGTPQVVAAPVAFESVSIGNAHQCALSTTGVAYCWGDNTFGQLGTGDTVSRSAPTPVAGGVTFTSISAGGRSTCGVAGNQSVYCWGSNASGELGNGTTAPSTVPSLVPGSMHFVLVSVATGFACGRASEGTFCWGDNQVGELGTGDTTSSQTPVRVAGGLSFESLSADADHACGVTFAGAAYCWGSNLSGMLGIGSSDLLPHVVPLRVAGNISWHTVTAGDMTCGVASSGVAYCWGSNLYDLLASGTLTSVSMVPAIVWGGLTFRTVSSRGGDHACALAVDGTVYCWGAYVS